MGNNTRTEAFKNYFRKYSKMYKQFIVAAKANDSREKLAKSDI